MKFSCEESALDVVSHYIERPLMIRVRIVIMYACQDI